MGEVGEIGGASIVGMTVGAILRGDWAGTYIGASTFGLVAYALTKLPDRTLIHAQQRRSEGTE